MDTDWGVFRIVEKMGAPISVHACTLQIGREPVSPGGIAFSAEARYSGPISAVRLGVHIVSVVNLMHVVWLAAYIVVFG